MSNQSSSVLKLVSIYGSNGSAVPRTKQDAMGDIAAATALECDSLPECFVTSGEPVNQLLDAARGAIMLVLGKHGTHGMLHNASASVGEACIRLAACAVVIVPHR